MSLKDLNLASGEWLVANCGKFPSEKNCQLVLMAPIGQKDDLVEAATNHAIKTHKHQDSSQLRQQIAGIFEKIKI